MAKKEKKSRRKDEQGLAAAQREKNVTEKEREPKERKESPRPVPKSAAERRKDRHDGIVKTVFAAALGFWQALDAITWPAARANTPGR